MTVDVPTLALIHLHLVKQPKVSHKDPTVCNQRVKCSSHLEAQWLQCCWMRPSICPGVFWTPAPGTSTGPCPPGTRSGWAGQRLCPASPLSASFWAPGSSWCSCRKSGPFSCWPGRWGVRPPVAPTRPAGSSILPLAGRRCAAAGRQRRWAWCSGPPGPPWRAKGWWWHWRPNTHLREKSSLFFNWL